MGSQLTAFFIRTIEGRRIGARTGAGQEHEQAEDEDQDQDQDQISMTS